MKLTKKQLNQIEKFAEKKHKGLDYDHNMKHVRRVIKFAMFLAKKERADINICKVAAYLHDIGLSVKSEGHEKRSAKMAKLFLQKLNLDKNFIENVAHAIECHGMSLVHNARTIEAKIIHDADKLDIIGPYGFCRVFSDYLVFKKFNLIKAISKVEEVILRAYNNFQTKTAKKLAKEGHLFMQNFYKLYNKWDKEKIK